MAKKLNKVVFILLFFGVQCLKGQTDSLNFFKPYLLSNHPLTIFTSRINHQFNFTPNTRWQLSATLSRGNVWLPYAEVKTPLNEDNQEFMASYPWHLREREDNLNPVNDFTSRSLVADGVYSTFQIEVKAPLTRKTDIQIQAKANSISAGKKPYSLLTNDEVLEWFHSNVAGGEDPFGRKERGFDKIGFQFTDRNGETLSFTKAKVLFTEISSSFNYYPTISWFKKNNISSIFSVHPGISLLNEQFTFDIGASSTLSKYWKLKKKRVFTMGVSGGILAPNLFQDKVIEFIQYPILASTEWHWNYLIPLKNNRSFIIAVNYHLQSSLFPSDEKDYYILKGDRITSHWSYAISKLHTPLQAWSFVFSLEKNGFNFGCFFREDFVVDNAPDFQVGWAISKKL